MLVTASWTIGELSARVESALAGSDYVPPENGQVRAVPDLRTIRYYTTLGLLDRPAEMRGRTALYGRRHLLQLVAIKRLQAQGMTLGQIQARLGALDDRALAKVAAVKGDAGAAAGTGTGAGARRGGEFWRATPSPSPSPSPSTSTSTSTSTSRATSTVRQGETKIRVAPGVYLVVEDPARLTQARRIAPMVEQLLALTEEGT